MINSPLEINGKKIYTLTALQEDFDLSAVLECYKNGELLNWLKRIAQSKERYERKAAEVEALDENTVDFVRRLCAVFEVDYSADMEVVFQQQERIAKLRTYTDDAEAISNIELVAFDQEELTKLLHSGAEKIYLCGDSFVVPASQKNKCYIGVNNPGVHIGGEIPENWAKQNIEFVGCTVDNLPQKPLLLDIPDHIKSCIEVCARVSLLTAENGDIGSCIRRAETMLLGHRECFSTEGFRQAEGFLENAHNEAIPVEAFASRDCSIPFETQLQTLVEKVTEDFGAFFNRVTVDISTKEISSEAAYDIGTGFLRATRTFTENMMKSFSVEEE